MKETGQVYPRELKEEKDGFRWYQTHLGRCYGADSMDNTTLIPLSRGYDGHVIYIPVNDRGNGGFFEVTTLKGGVGICDINGNEIIPPRRGYIYVCSHKDWYSVTVKKGIIFKRQLNGVCDSQGNEIIPPIYKHYIYYDKECGFYYFKNRHNHVREKRTLIEVNHFEGKNEV